MDIKTFDNVTGPSVFFRAAGHPLAAERAPGLISHLAGAGPIAVFDPDGYLSDLEALYDLSGLAVAEVYVQRVEDLGQVRARCAVQTIDRLRASRAKTVFAVAFDHERLRRQLVAVMPDGMELVTLDQIRLPEEMVTVRGRYLDPLNFASDFILFRDGGGWHTRLVTGNYWHGHGGQGVRLWLRLFDRSGAVQATWWHEPKPGLSSIELDSRAVRDHVGGDFEGSLFIHAIGAAGHDVIKYALDIYGDDARSLSCTHDSNPWPADYYAGLPAPAAGEQILLWVQNCHPTAIPAGAISLNVMGADSAVVYPHEIAAFGTEAIEIAGLLPDARWPQQIEIYGSRHFGRPRYEVRMADRRRFIAHANVERADLKPDAALPELIGGTLGKGYILPGSVPPLERWHSWFLPTPMSRSTLELPLQIALFDPAGEEMLRMPLGRLARGHDRLIDVAELLGSGRPDYGHVELTYDFSHGGEGDGWIHALFRYQLRQSGQFADTSFGAHVYNVPFSYKKEPQSYIGKPPGITTRLFLRLDGGSRDTLCHLIYPSSRGVWHAHSETSLLLHNAAGEEVARRTVRIAQGGSLFWQYHALFDVGERRDAGPQPSLIVRDTTCRLFGYHGLLSAEGGFAYDHMFGF